ncbi:MAG: hypothetical protein LKF88_04945 [Microbacteriaceae bacterium]|jgi:hypothetical protein|nr:hypothetical protein [Microbacteriaceae bacterium]MCI1206819.1 hypothetical protein [Microbacteriaceae bacterium]
MLPRLEILNPRLFIRKMVLLTVTTLLLAPLIVEKMLIPAALYIGGLIVLHVVVLAVYLYRVPWRELWRNRAEFALRVAAIVFFVCLLALVRFEGDTAIVLMDIGIALVLHCLIICGFHVRVTPRTRPTS